MTCAMAKVAEWEVALTRLFCDDCGCHIPTGAVYYSGESGDESYYPDGYVEAICQHCFDEERKSWTIPITFTPGGRMLLWGWAFGWLKTGFWRLHA